MWQAVSMHTAHIKHQETDMKAVRDKTEADLMRTTDEIQIMFVQKLCYDLGTKCKWNAAIVLAPPHCLLVRVRPEQVTKQALVWNVRWTHYTPYLLHWLQVWT